jgi:hypothetical protein
MQIFFSFVIVVVEDYIPIMLVPPLVLCVCLLTLLILQYFDCMPEFNSEEAGISMLSCSVDTTIIS